MCRFKSDRSMYLCSIGSREEGVGCPRIAFTTGSTNPGIVSKFLSLFHIYFDQFWDVSISIRIRTGAWVDFVSMFNSLFVSLNVLFFQKKVCVFVWWFQTFCFVYIFFLFIILPVDVIFAVVWVVIVDHKLHIVHIQASAFVKLVLL